jgi:hypothetical protein
VFPNVSEEHAAAIGYVAIRWSGVEEALRYVVARLLGIDGYGPIVITANLNAPAILNLITVLLSLAADDTLISTWQTLFVRHEELRPKRNEAIHSEWQVVGDIHMALRYKARQHFTFSFVEVPTEKLNDLSEKALLLSEDILTFASAISLAGVSKVIQSAHPPGLKYPSLTEPPPSQPQKQRVKRPSSAQKRKQQEDGGDLP